MTRSLWCRQKKTRLKPCLYESGTIVVHNPKTSLLTCPRWQLSHTVSGRSEQTKYRCLQKLWHKHRYHLIWIGTTLSRWPRQAITQSEVIEKYAAFYKRVKLTRFWLMLLSWQPLFQMCHVCFLFQADTRVSLTHLRAPNMALAT